MGVVMATMALTALAYGEFVVLWVVFYTGNFVLANAIIYTLLTVMAVWCHLKTMLSQPGVVPREALPLRDESEDGAAAANHTLCGRCESYKPTRREQGKRERGRGDAKYEMEGMSKLDATAAEAGEASKKHSRQEATDAESPSSPCADTADTAGNLDVKGAVVARTPPTTRGGALEGRERSLIMPKREVLERLGVTEEDLQCLGMADESMEQLALAAAVDEQDPRYKTIRQGMDGLELCSDSAGTRVVGTRS
eukprot:g5778.t1